MKASVQTGLRRAGHRLPAIMVSVIPGFQRILVPVVFAEPAQKAMQHAVQQAAWLARRFKAEIVLLHVVTPVSYPADLLEEGDEITARDLQARVIQKSQKNLEAVNGPELDGITVKRVLLRGDPAREIGTAARDQNADLIVMPTRGEAFFSFLLGSVTAKVLHETDLPVWTGAHLEETPASDFSVHRVLCAVNLTDHDRHTLPRAAAMATGLDAALTLVHITSSVERFGPGGTYVDAEWKKTLTGIAAEEIAKLQKEVGTAADVVIDSGNVPELLNRAAERTRADLLVIGHIPGRSHWGNNGNGYGIIRESKIPVLSV
jgi:nucleotide-binding universal stress UspA family protein